MKLIFVYNADSGLINTLIDIGHKALSPQTYQCNLCGLTFGLVSEHKQWKQFREESSKEMEFLHRDEFEQKYARKLEREGCRRSAERPCGIYNPQRNALRGISNHAVEYPVILKKENNDLSVVITPTELNQIKTLDELIERVKIVSKMPASK